MSNTQDFYRKYYSLEQGDLSEDALNICELMESYATSQCQRYRGLRWEIFCDRSYYDLWAVRPVGDKDFNSQKLFHVQSKEEAEALRNLLSQLPVSSVKPESTPVLGVEEAAKEYAQKKSSNSNYHPIREESFIAGATWQASQPQPKDEGYWQRRCEAAERIVKHLEGFDEYGYVKNYDDYTVWQSLKQSQPTVQDEEPNVYCGKCGTNCLTVRPGKYQCPKCE